MERRAIAVIFETCCLLAVSPAAGAERPAQFEVWGSYAGEQAPLPAGWKEVDLLLVGPPGTGKSHVCQALGLHRP